MFGLGVSEVALLGGGCVCIGLIMVLVLGGIGYFVWKNRSANQGDAASTNASTQTTSPQTTGAAPGAVDTSQSVDSDEHGRELIALLTLSDEDLDHATASAALGQYLTAVLAHQRDASRYSREMMDELEALADALEASLVVKKYNPSVLAEFGLDRMRILAELNRSAHKIGTSSTARLLILLRGEPQAATLPQLWDMVMEHPEDVDLRIGERFGVAPEQGEELMGLANNRTV